MSKNMKSFQDLEEYEKESKNFLSNLMNFQVDLNNYGGAGAGV